jgi:phosphatidylserine/phosphatidylglycerophosphate/cardiolipin synthase-like enzyme
VIMYRIRDLTVHTKLMLVDDVFASIGSANFFSRSMTGTDSELGCTFVTTGPTVRNLRVRLWAEHLRTPLNEQLTPALEDLATALGIWRTEWLLRTARRTPGAEAERRPATHQPSGSWCPPVTPADHPIDGGTTEAACLRCLARRQERQPRECIEPRCR